MVFTMALMSTDMEEAADHQGTHCTMAVLLQSIRRVSRVTHCNHSDKSREVMWCFIVMQQRLHLSGELFDIVNN